MFDINKFTRNIASIQLGAISNIYKENIYIQILFIIYHEIQHLHQYYTYDNDKIGNNDLKNIKNRIMYYNRKTIYQKIVINNY